MSTAMEDSGLRLLTTYVEPDALVMDSLKDMRKAHTGRNRVELQAQRLERSCQAQLDKLKNERAEANAKARGKRWPPRPSRRKKEKILSQKELEHLKKEKGHRDLQQMLDAPPLVRKDMEDIKKEATASYALGVANPNIDAKSSRIGIPKKIYPDLIRDIVREMTEKKKAAVERRQMRALAREKAREAHEEQKKQWQGSISSSPTPIARIVPETLESEPAVEAARMDVRRPELVREWQSEHTHRCSSRSSRSSIAVCRSRTDEQSPVSSPSQRSRRASSTGFGPKAGSSPSKQLAKKVALEQERERRLQEEIFNRKNAKLLKEVKKENDARARLWLTNIVVFSRIHSLASLFTKVVLPARRKVADCMMNNKQKDAVLFIEQWWSLTRLVVLAFKNPQTLRRLRFFVRRWWFLTKRRVAHRAVYQIVRFLKDSAGSTMVKKLYAYRTKAAKVQKWFRDWLHIQETRTHVLWMAMEKIGRKRYIASRRAATLAERRAVRSTAKLGGFKETIARLNTVGGKLDEYLTEHERVKAEREFIASGMHQKEAAEIKKAQTYTPAPRRSSVMNLEVKNVSESMTDAEKKRIANENATKLMLKMQKVMNVDKRAIKGLEEAPVQNYPTMAQRYKTWYWRTMRHSATARRFGLVRQLLTDQRRRHILASANARVNTKSAEPLSSMPVGKGTKVSMSALRRFLATDEATVDKDFNFYEDDSSQDEDDAVSRRKKAAKISARDARPPFLLFSQGALDYFRKEVPLDFFDKNNY